MMLSNASLIKLGRILFRFYKYPNLKLGESIRFLSWINYNYDLFNASDYYSTYVTGFHWFNLFDDYDFVEGV